MLTFCSNNKKSEMTSHEKEDAYTKKNNDDSLLFSLDRPIREIPKSVIGDTIFRYKFPAVFNFDKANELYFLVEENLLMSLTGVKVDSIGYIDNKYFIDDFFVKDNFLFTTYNSVDYDVVNMDIHNRKDLRNKISSLVDFQIKGIVDEDRILLIKDNRNDEAASDEYKYNYYLFNHKNSKMEHKFSNNKNVTFSNNNFYEFDINEMYNKIRVINKISINLINKEKIFFDDTNYGVPLYFCDDFYLVKDDDKIIKVRKDNNSLDMEIKIMPKYNYKIKVLGGKLLVYGWLNSDDEKLQEYYFVKQEFNL